MSELMILDMGRSPESPGGPPKPLTLPVEIGLRYLEENNIIIKTFFDFHQQFEELGQFENRCIKKILNLQNL